MLATLVQTFGNGEIVFTPLQVVAKLLSAAVSAVGPVVLIFLCVGGVYLCLRTMGWLAGPGYWPKDTRTAAERAREEADLNKPPW